MQIHTRVFTFLLSVVVCPVSASRIPVYRCVQADGHIRYQQIPCHFEDSPILIKDRSSGWSPLRPGEQALLERYRKKDAVQRRKSTSKSKQPVKESRACWTRRRQLEAIRIKLRRGYNLGEGEALHRKQDDYRDFLRQFCP